MNFLAHAYLSFRQPELLLGNLISDFVKGKKKFDYPSAILRGIDLHRAIDKFTDDHPINARAKLVFKPAVGLYSSAFLDVVYDHFLATDELAFPGNSLHDFSQWVYGSLEGQAAFFPDQFARMFPYMKEQNWLLNYKDRWGIERSMEGLVRRAKFIDDFQPAFKAFETDYQLLKDCFQRFFPELLLFVNDEYRRQLIRPETL
ncbi:ACP phosphodiesterase [Flavihumibacter sp. UBA7668]|uniref:acyl carrier protein phosphodiesterase n=1 Tax=Flavihumibacter sp. UBA7668 TaxID=1946542 RepID=UPI0025C6B089|nr:ACP phosphodiesterase [Flavihumibacter sp. UBA7668]